MKERVQITVATMITAALLLSPVVRATDNMDQSNTPAQQSVVEYPEFKSLVQRAYSGNPQAQYTLALIYEEGRGGIQKDLAYAMSWYEEAARNGLKRATEKLHQLSRTN